MTKSNLLAAFALLLAACRTAPSGADGFRTISHGYQTGITSGTVRVARTEAEWTSLWREHTSRELPRPSVPTIDFAKEMVVCVLSGERPSGGYGIEVVDATFDGKALLLGTRETKPAADAVVPMMITRPFHMIATPTTDADCRIAPR